MTDPKQQLGTYRGDPLAFLGDLRVPAAGGARRLGDIAAPFQQERFAALAPSLLAVARGEKPPKARFWFEGTKGSAKTSDIAAVILWLLLFGRAGMLIQVLAADQEQADESRKALKDIIRENPEWQQVIEVLADSARNKATDSTAAILTTDNYGLHGGRPNVVVWDELTHLPPGKFEAAENLADNLDKMANGLGIVGTNAGWRETQAWTWREIAHTSPEWSFHCFTGIAPWILPARVEEARRRNSPQRFARLWRGVWASGAGDLLPEDWLTRSLVLSGPADYAESHWVYAAGIDLSTKRDHSAICVLARHCGGWERKRAEPVVRPRVIEALRDLGYLDVEWSEGESVFHQGSGKTRLIASRVWKPGGVELNFAEIEAEILALHRRFGFGVFMDPWQGVYMIQRLEAARVQCWGVDPTANNLTAQFHTYGRRFKTAQSSFTPTRGCWRTCALRPSWKGVLRTRASSFPPRRQRGTATWARRFCLGFSALPAWRRRWPWRTENSS